MPLAAAFRRARSSPHGPCGSRGTRPSSPFSGRREDREDALIADEARLPRALVQVVPLLVRSHAPARVHRVARVPVDAGAVERRQEPLVGGQIPDRAPRLDHPRQRPRAPEEVALADRARVDHAGVLVAQGLEDVRRVGRRPRTVHRGVLSFEPVPEEPLQLRALRARRDAAEDDAAVAFQQRAAPRRVPDATDARRPGRLAARTARGPHERLERVDDARPLRRWLCRRLVVRPLRCWCGLARRLARRLCRRLVVRRRRQLQRSSRAAGAADNARRRRRVDIDGSAR